jgi:hypothetical protein
MAQWSIPLPVLKRRTEARMDKVFRRAAMDLFYACALPSPIDTGRFRANWNVAYNAVDKSTTASTDQSRVLTEINKVATLPTDGSLYLTNSLVYAITLEYGHSAQAPNGMVRVALAQWPQILKNALKA